MPAGDKQRAYSLLDRRKTQSVMATGSIGASLRGRDPGAGRVRSGAAVRVMPLRVRLAGEACIRQVDSGGGQSNA